MSSPPPKTALLTVLASPRAAPPRPRRACAAWPPGHTRSQGRVSLREWGRGSWAPSGLVSLVRRWEDLTEHSGSWKGRQGGRREAPREWRPPPVRDRVCPGKWQAWSYTRPRRARTTDAAKNGMSSTRNQGRLYFGRSVGMGSERAHQLAPRTQGKMSRYVGKARMINLGNSMMTAVMTT